MQLFTLQACFSFFLCAISFCRCCIHAYMCMMSHDLISEVTEKVFTWKWLHWREKSNLFLIWFVVAPQEISLIRRMLKEFTEKLIDLRTNFSTLHLNYIWQCLFRKWIDIKKLFKTQPIFLQSFSHKIYVNSFWSFDKIRHILNSFFSLSIFLPFFAYFHMHTQLVFVIFHLIWFSTWFCIMSWFILASRYAFTFGISIVHISFAHWVCHKCKQDNDTHRTQEVLDFYSLFLFHHLLILLSLSSLEMMTSSKWYAVCMFV